MIMLSKSGIHAINALIRLAGRPADYTGVQALAEATGAPRGYLGKLLQQLTRVGLLESQKGLGGGFRLKRSPASISLFDIVSPLEDIQRWSLCVLCRDECNSENPCSMHSHWAPVRNTYLDMLHDTTLDQLSEVPNRKGIR